MGSAIAFQDGRVVDISNRRGVPGNFDFANIAVWNRSVFQHIPPGQKISFIPILADWISQGGKIGGVVLDDGNWFNLGSRAEYFDVHRAILAGWRLDYVKDREWLEPVHPTAVVDPRARLSGCSVVGRDCRVGGNAVLEDTIVWPGSQIASNAELFSCIVRARKTVTGIHRNIDV